MEHLDSHLRSFWKWGRRILTARTTSPPDHVDYVFSLPKFFLAQFFTSHRTHITASNITLLKSLRTSLWCRNPGPGTTFSTLPLSHLWQFLHILLFGTNLLDIINSLNRLTPLFYLSAFCLQQRDHCKEGPWNDFLHTSSDVRESPVKKSELRKEFTFRDKDTWPDRHFERTSWAPCWRSQMIIVSWK